MHNRQQRILQAIIDAFIQTAHPVGSKMLYEDYDFKISPATIRNEMATLEREGYIVQPHTSAGRVPTNQAYRAMVNQMQPDNQLMNRVRQDLSTVRDEYYLERTKEKLYDLVGILASATLPEVDRFFYVGVGNILRKPEFAADPGKTTRVVETIENELYEIISDLEVGPEGGIYIGEENIIPEFSSCSLLAIPYSHKGFNGVIGVLGSTRMDYAYNMAALRAALEFL
jgi:transcriptional regulator of heat shock response